MFVRLNIHKPTTTQAIRHAISSMATKGQTPPRGVHATRNQAPMELSHGRHYNRASHARTAVRARAHADEQKLPNRVECLPGVAAPHRILDDGGWKPLAVSATVTLLVAGVHTGVIDALMLAVMRVQHLGG